MQSNDTMEQRRVSDTMGESKISASMMCADLINLKDTLRHLKIRESNIFILMSWMESLFLILD